MLYRVTASPLKHNIVTVIRHPDFDLSSTLRHFDISSWISTSISTFRFSRNPEKQSILAIRHVDFDICSTFRFCPNPEKQSNLAIRHVDRHVELPNCFVFQGLGKTEMSNRCRNRHVESPKCFVFQGFVKIEMSKSMSKSSSKCRSVEVSRRDRNRGAE